MDIENTFLSLALKSTTDEKITMIVKLNLKIQHLKIVFNIMMDLNGLVPEMLRIIFWTKA